MNIDMNLPEWRSDSELGIWILVAYFVGIAIVSIGIGLWGILSIRSGQRWQVELFSDILVRLSVFRMLTVALVVGGVLILAVERRLDETSAAILSGIIGYVLGGISRDQPQPPIEHYPTNSPDEGSPAGTSAE